MKTLVAAASLLLAAPAPAEVVKSGDHGFELRYSQLVPASPKEAMAAFANVGRWWDKEHTYSGSSSNLSLNLDPGGCFCERFQGGGGIEHLRVTYVDPGKRVVLTGSLGPLLYDGTSGVMDVQFKPAGSGTEMIMNYKVAGFANGSADKMAPLVDRVLGGMVSRFSAYATPPRAAR
ncbi:SRPBCC family protein [soil metagenome]